LTFDFSRRCIFFDLHYQSIAMELAPAQNVNTGTRIGSMVLDHIFMTLIVVLFMVPMMIIGIFGTMQEAFTVSHEQNDVPVFGGSGFYIFLFGFSLYFCKDGLRGRSLAKRILKLQVVNNRSGLPASPWRCLVRNLFCIIWPVEAIVTLVNPARRLGDRVAGTRVASYDSLTAPKPPVNWLQFFLSLIVIFLLLVTVTLALPSFKMDQVKYVESSYNEGESRQLENKLSGSLAQFLDVSVKVFDKVEKGKVKYVSVICHLRENYLTDPEESSELQELIKDEVYAAYRREDITGIVKMVYEGRRNFQMRTFYIGR
jgi:uncharacterized RDD family membrane protein YckC